MRLSIVLLLISFVSGADVKISSRRQISFLGDDGKEESTIGSTTIPGILEEIRQLKEGMTKQGETIANQGTTISKQEETIKQQGETISNQGTTISKQEETIKQQGETISNQGTTIANQGTTIETLTTAAEVWSYYKLPVGSAGYNSLPLHFKYTWNANTNYGENKMYHIAFKGHLYKQNVAFTVECVGYLTNSGLTRHSCVYPTISPVINATAYVTSDGRLAIKLVAIDDWHASYVKTAFIGGGNGYQILAKRTYKILSVGHFDNNL